MSKTIGNEARSFVVCAACVLLAMLAPQARGQFYEEDFNNVSESGEGEDFFTGAGFQMITEWDAGLTGENAFAGTELNARFDSVSARGDATGDVDGTGAGEIEVSGVSFAALFEEFTNASFAGGGEFAGPAATNGFVTNWDNALAGETAFFGVKGDAVLGASGSASAQVSPFAGNPGAAGQISVTGVTLNSGNWFAGLTFAAQPLEGANPLFDPGFEEGSLAQWLQFGFNNFAVTQGPNNPAPRSGTWLYKTYGMFNSADNSSGIYQDLEGKPGQTWELSLFVRNDTVVNGGIDDITGSNPNQFIIKVEFYNAASAMIGEDELIALDNTTPTDQWLERTLQSTAPAETVTARAVLLFRNINWAGGAAFVDDVSFKVIDGPAQGDVDLAQISLTADVKGETLGAGSTLGAYQLRLEDAGGNRLAFLQTANGAFQAAGGALSTAAEYGPDDMPTNGAFDVNSPSITVVLVFDPDNAPAWGTGGLLTIDNIVLTNNDTTGSAWYAGLFFDGLDLGTGPFLNASNISLSADMLGATVGGDYLLRIEGNSVTQAGLDQEFESATGSGGGLYLTTNGPDFQFVPSWDGGISNSGAFGGYSPGAELCESFPPFFFCDTTGFIARAVLSGGNPGAYGQLKVQNVNFDPGETWYTGMTFPNQGVASTDLSTVFLFADIRGRATPGGAIGTYELRIEDAQGDRLYITGTAPASWTTVGGALSTFTEAGAAGGGGDGNFDLDSSSYTVVIATGENAELTWGNGGILEVDNVFLTPVDVLNQVGTITFDMTANGQKQAVGGLLAAGASTFSPDALDENFATATGTGGGVFYDSTGVLFDGNWDDGITGETMFFGGYGTGSVAGPTTTAAAQACLTCGVGGTPAGQFIVSNAQLTGANTWYGGVNWPGMRIDFSQFDPADITLTAKVKGEVNGAGSTLGMYTLRLEDPNLDFLAFDVPLANGEFQSVGGTLDTAVEGGTGDGGTGSDFQFNYAAGTYTLTLLFLGGLDGSWGTGGKLTVDDIYLELKGFRLSDAQTYTVTIAFRNELATWGTSGRLVVDNIVLTPAANSDGDLDVDLIDFARFQACIGDLPSEPGCESADLDGDGDIDAADHVIFEKGFHGPQP